jgi:hypothetical protein
MGEMNGDWVLYLKGYSYLASIFIIAFLLEANQRECSLFNMCVVVSEKTSGVLMTDATVTPDSLPSMLERVEMDVHPLLRTAVSQKHSSERN